jgi:hypothetical protein
MKISHMVKFSYLVGFLVVLALVMCVDSSLSEKRKALQGGPRMVLGDSKDRGKVFEYYEPKGQSKRASNWTSALDLTGVSWNDTRTCTLISRQHVVMAAHYIRPSDVPVMFHDDVGTPHERYIIAVKSLAPQHDVAIGKLNLPLPTGVKHYDLASPADARIGNDALVTDQTKHINIHQISMRDASGRIGFAYDPALPVQVKRNLVVGDSGNPSFILSGGDLKLLETHTFGGPGSGPDYSNPLLQSAIREAMNGL